MMELEFVSRSLKLCPASRRARGSLYGPTDAAHDLAGGHFSQTDINSANISAGLYPGFVSYLGTPFWTFLEYAPPGAPHIIGNLWH